MNKNLYLARLNAGILFKKHGESVNKEDLQLWKRRMNRKYPDFFKGRSLCFLFENHFQEAF